MNLKSMTESPQCHHMVCGRQLCISNPCSASSPTSLCGSKPLSSILDRAEGLLGELGHLPHFPELQFVAVWLNILNRECLGVMQLPEITCKSKQIRVKLKDEPKPLLITTKIDNMSKTSCRRNRWRNKNIANLFTWWLHQKSLPFPHVLPFLSWQDKVLGFDYTFSHLLGEH